MTDAIDLQAALIVRSPDVASWTPTIRLTRIRCSAAGGFVIDVDHPIPASWKWPSTRLPDGSPDPESTDNFQWTAWIFRHRGGLWVGAGFVQMWAGRPMGDRSLPPLLADVDGAPGWTRWWGDARGFWADLGDAPVPGETIGILISAGNARLVNGSTSVAERSNLVLWTVRADDSGDVAYLEAAPPIDPPPVPPIDPPPPVDPPPVASDARLLTLEQRVAELIDEMRMLTVNVVHRLDRHWIGTINIKYLGASKIDLAPAPPPDQGAIDRQKAAADKGGVVIADRRLIQKP